MVGHGHGVVVIAVVASVPDVVSPSPGDHGVRDGGGELSLGRLQRLPFHPGHNMLDSTPLKACSPVGVHDPVVVVADVAAVLVIGPRLVARRYQGTLHCMAEREPVAQLIHLQG